MWLKIKNVILTHLVQSIVLTSVAVAGVAGIGYYVIQQVNPPNNTHGGSTKSCVDNVNIGTVAVEKDPAGDPEAWLRFDYKATASQPINCQYTITFYDSRQEIIRTISDVEDTFQSPGGQIYNGYSSTPYQDGMTAKVAIQ